MNNQIRSILLKFDEIDCYETPSKFNYEDLEYRVIVLSRDLEGVFEIGFKVDNEVEDASFYGDIIIPNDLIIEPKVNCLYSIRISNFGNLATFNFEDSYSDTVKNKFIEILQKHNFTFISSEELDKDYDGSFDKFNKILGGQKPSWRIRYFDYL